MLLMYIYQQKSRAATTSAGVLIRTVAVMGIDLFLGIGSYHSSQTSDSDAAWPILGIFAFMNFLTAYALARPSFSRKKDKSEIRWCETPARSIRRMCLSLWASRRFKTCTAAKPTAQTTATRPAIRAKARQIPTTICCGRWSTRRPPNSLCLRWITAIRFRPLWRSEQYIHSWMRAARNIWMCAAVQTRTTTMSRSIKETAPFHRTSSWSSRLRATGIFSARR